MPRPIWNAPMRTRPLTADEAALWARVMAGVRPIAGRAAAPAKAPASAIPPPRQDSERRPDSADRGAPPRAPAPTAPSKRRGAASANTLDGSWDRDFARGTIVPDRTIDLHGHTLDSAHTLLDRALDQSIRGGDRIVLLVTGKPPRPASDRPPAPHPFRGAIRAAVGDWLAGSRHAAAIAAVRAAHPRHGGAGALYIVLRRRRFTGAGAANS